MADHVRAMLAFQAGGAVVFDTNELLRLFERFRVTHYEDVEDVADFGMQKVRVVRLAAEKPVPSAR